jgi:hypothetical protein
MSKARLREHKTQLKGEIDLLKRALKDITDDQSIDESDVSIEVLDYKQSLNSSTVEDVPKQSLHYSDQDFQGAPSFGRSTTQQYENSRARGSDHEISNLPQPRQQLLQSRYLGAERLDLTAELREIERSMDRLQNSSSPLVRTIAKEISGGRLSRKGSRIRKVGKRPAASPVKADTSAVNQSLLAEIKSLRRENFNLKAQLTSLSPKPRRSRSSQRTVRAEWLVKWRHCRVCDMLLMQGLTTVFCPKHGTKPKFVVA